MKAVDTNILVHAHRADSPHHSPAREALRGLVESGLRWGVPWPCVHDARIAAICLAHGVDELLTADRDFSYFPDLRTTNPLVR